ncbi:hypothetical protein [Flavobacterium branchiicola]|uniref:Uncharacterized protein n=1 Tax=Flavobacterium branchiicola TaxID=1114875 RepID=A0ABV9P8L7_9FLAO|nr:hypothetical protein [Flavobacterium branchiicola]MBS7252448.1 hypothetical protein [Flavobacterium branchiicola]
MEVEKRETVTDFVELLNKVKYFKKLKPDPKNDNSFNVWVKIASCSELNLTIASLLKSSISVLKEEPTEAGMDVLLLLEMALQLLTSDEMELLDIINQLPPSAKSAS